MEAFWAGFEKRAGLGQAIAGAALAGVAGGTLAAVAAGVKNHGDVKWLAEQGRGHDSKEVFRGLGDHTKGISLKTMADIQKQKDSGAATLGEERVLQMATHALPFSGGLALTTNNGFDSQRTVLAPDETHPSILAHEVGHHLDDMKFPTLSEAEKTLVRARSLVDKERAAWDAAPGPIDPEIRRRALGTYERQERWPQLGLIGGAAVGAILGAALKNM